MAGKAVLDIGQGFLAINLRLTCPEEVQIRSVEDENDRISHEILLLGAGARNIARQRLGYITRAIGRNGAILRHMPRDALPPTL